MPIAAAGIGLVGSLASSLFGNSAAQQQAQQATADTQAAVQQWLSTQPLTPQQLQEELTNYQVTGQLSPQMEAAYQQSQTNLKNLDVSGTGRAAEVQALSQMQNLAQSGGLDAQAQQQVQQAINQTNANTQGQIGAITQNFAARGEGGAGAQLAAELQAAQGGANSAAASGQSAAAADEQRALQAMSNASTAGNALNASDYSEAAAAAAAQDAINRFNTQNSQSVSNANVSSTNAAQAANLANAQSVANANTGVANQQQLLNSQNQQQAYEDQVQQTQGIANAYQNAAGQANKNATNTANQAAGIAGTISQGAGAIGQAFANNSTSNATNAQQAQNANNSVDSAISGMNSSPSSNYFSGDYSFPSTSSSSSPYTLGSYSSGSSQNDAYGGLIEKMANGGEVLDANARKHIAAKNFAGPDRSYPIEDEVHARNALARVAQHGSPELQAQVKAKVHAKYPNIGKAEGGEVKPADLYEELAELVKRYKKGK